MRHLECQLEEKNQELLRVSHRQAATVKPIRRFRTSTLLDPSGYKHSQISLTCISPFHL